MLPFGHIVSTFPLGKKAHSKARATRDRGGGGLPLAKRATPTCRKNAENSIQMVDIAKRENGDLWEDRLGSPMTNQQALLIMLHVE
jgi:hypothetical protein